MMLWKMSDNGSSASMLRTTSTLYTLQIPPIEENISSPRRQVTQRAQNGTVIADKEPLVRNFSHASLASAKTHFQTSIFNPQSPQLIENNSIVGVDGYHDCLTCPLRLWNTIGRRFKSGTMYWMIHYFLSRLGIFLGLGYDSERFFLLKVKEYSFILI